MKVAVFSTRNYDRQFLDRANAAANHELIYFETGLEPKTALLADSCPAICAFVNDDLGAETFANLSDFEAGRPCPNVL